MDAEIKNVTSAIMLQAVKDYFKSSPKGQTQILKDLRSTWMDYITDGTSVLVAEQLELHPQAIAERLGKLPRES